MLNTAVTMLRRWLCALSLHDFADIGTSGRFEIIHCKACGRVWEVDTRSQKVTELS